MSRPFLDTAGYSHAELFWYVGGFLAWTPAYVAILVIAVRRRRLEIPALAATGNITWEALWGFVYGDDVDMGWGLQAVYIGAFLLDVGILVSVFRYGRTQASAPMVRQVFPVLVCGLLAAWAAVIVGLVESGRDLPLGSVSAYLVNLAESGVYLWFGLTVLDVRHMSRTVAWSKFVGTAMVSVFVLLRYPHDGFVLALAGVVFVLDLAYLVLLRARRRAAVAVADRSGASGGVGEVDERDRGGRGSVGVQASEGVLPHELLPEPRDRLEPAVGGSHR